jgi:xylan 1,4-beta-xylosidase
VPLDAKRAAAPVREHFDGKQLPIDFQWLRSPFPEELFSLNARPGFLRLYGRETIGSLFRQSLVARRQQAHCYSAITAMEFEPAHYQQAAGLGVLLQLGQVPLSIWCRTTRSTVGTCG